MAALMVAVSVSQYLLQVIADDGGSRRELALSGVAIATSSLMSPASVYSLEGWCVGNSRWSSLWRRAISKAWNLHLLPQIAEWPALLHLAHPSVFSDAILQSLVRYSSPRANPPLFLTSCAILNGGRLSFLCSCPDFYRIRNSKLRSFMSFNHVVTLFVPYGVGAAASTRISNELGAGNPQSARVAVDVVMILGISEA
ncbi:hypothetical protein F3Y22_tig00111105pilonHSYRG00189 [Hibiscus syriacus]|uniref:Uncharacterized protein n=1 Tax=Hibiscus syriacus TaxID=106335 RepID=A0A6A2YYK6_HIBSY|nr:hypothetical protein F3Y22_tig00111105pilonHSYRG00189 [Hibiscus syriacus]